MSHRFCLLTLLLCSSSALSSPFDLIGVGSVNAALAGAGSVLAGAQATYTNPAALTLSPDCMLDIAYSALVPSFEGRIVNPGSLGNLRPYQHFDSSGAFDASRTLGQLEGAVKAASNLGRLDGFVVMTTLPLRRVIKALRQEFTVGALVFLPGSGGEVVAVEGVTPDDFVWPWLGSRLHRLMAVISAGAEVWRGRVALGAGAMILADIAGSVESVAPIAVFNPSNPSSPPPPAPSVATFRQKLGTDAAPVVGVLVRPTDFLTLGLSFRGEMDLSLDFRVKAGVSFDLGGVPIQAEIPYRLQAHFFYLPAELTFGAFARPWEWLQLSADMTLSFTRDLGSHMPITAFTLDPSAVGPDGRLLALESLGYFRATSAPAPRVSTRNIVIPKVGIEAKPLKWLSIMCGYAYHPSPFNPDQKFSNLVLDQGFHRIGFGLSAHLLDPTGTFVQPLQLSSHFGAIILNTRYNNVGRKDENGKQLAAGVVKTSGYGLGGGITLGLRF